MHVDESDHIQAGTKSDGPAPLPLRPALTPRYLARGPNPALDFDRLTIRTGIGPGPVWDEARELEPSTLPPEGYALRITDCPAGPLAVIAAPDDRGAHYGAQALAVLATRTPTPTVPEITIRDWPTLSWRGSIEGFYGPPWSHQDRLDHLVFAGQHRLNTYVYAPKDDPYHRERWRDPYPEVEVARLGELVEAAREAHVDFVYAISPGLSMRYSDDGDQRALAAKARQLQRIGVNDFALLFDDIPTELQDGDDLATFGRGRGTAGAAHGRTCARFADAVLDAAGTRLAVVPTDYAGVGPSPYREWFAREAPADVLVWWTGRDIVVGEVTREDIDAAAASYRRDLLLWDNFPVNDFARSRTFLGPLVGRATDVAGSALRGISANPMIEAAASQLALATVAEWAWCPESYNPVDAAARALASVAGPLAATIAPLVSACSSWPPSARQSPSFDRLAAATLRGDHASIAELATGLRALAGVSAGLATWRRQGNVLDRLAEQLTPWAAAGAAAADAGLDALELLQPAAHANDGPRPGQLARTRASLTRAEAHYADVLRGALPGFVRAALARSATDGDGPTEAGPLAIIVCGSSPTAGDRALEELVRSRCPRVLLSEGGSPLELVGASRVSLVVITGSSLLEDAKAAATLRAPLVTCAHLVDLGLAMTAGVLTVQDTVVCTADELTEGLPLGRVPVYRGPGSLSWGDPGRDAAVAARSHDGRPVLFRYPPGSRLASGAMTVLGSTALFLGSEALAPWLVAHAGLALVTSAVDAALRAE